MVQILAFGRRDEVPASCHIPQLYTRPDEAVQVAAGLFSGRPFPHRDRCVYMGPANSAERILEALGAWVADLKAAGQLLVLHEPADVLPDDRLGPYALLADHLRMLAEARRDGFAGVRLVIELSWLSDADAVPAHLFTYEAMCEAVFTFQRQPIVAVAQYDAARLGERLASDLVKLHPILYIGRAFKRNPDYPPQGPESPGPTAPSASRPKPRGPGAGDIVASA